MGRLQENHLYINTIQVIIYFTIASKRLTTINVVEGQYSSLQALPEQNLLIQIQPQSNQAHHNVQSLHIPDIIHQTQMLRSRTTMMEPT